MTNATLKVLTLHGFFSHSWCGQGILPKKTGVFELGEVSFSVTPRSQTWKEAIKEWHNKITLWSMSFSLEKKKKTLRKRSKSPQNPIKPMEALVRNLASLNPHMRCIPLFPVNLRILQPSGIHQSSVWSHPLRPPWDHSILLGSRRPSPSGLSTVYEHQPKQGQIWKGKFPSKITIDLRKKFHLPHLYQLPPQLKKGQGVEGVLMPPNSLIYTCPGKIKNAAWFRYIPKQFSCSLSDVVLRDRSW